MVCRCGAPAGKGYIHRKGNIESNMIEALFSGHISNTPPTMKTYLISNILIDFKSIRQDSQGKLILHIALSISTWWAIVLGIIFYTRRGNFLRDHTRTLL